MPTFQELTDGMSLAHKKTVEDLLTTIAELSDTILDLQEELMIAGGADAYEQRRVRVGSLQRFAQIAGGLDIAEAPRLQDVQAAISEMHNKIESAENAEQFLNAALALGTKLAPLALAG